MIPIILSALFSYRNAIIAKQKGQNVLVWVIITVASLFIGMMAGTLVVFALFYKGQVSPADIQRFLAENPLREITIYAIASGGGLLVGYILGRMPDANGGDAPRM